MYQRSLRRVLSATTVLALALVFGSVRASSQTAPTPAATPLDGPRVFDSSQRGPRGRSIPGSQFRVIPTQGLKFPFALAFLPDGTVLITEREGQLRAVRAGALVPQPIRGVPAVSTVATQGLNDIAIHPKFSENRWIYFTYYKPDPVLPGAARAALARGRFDGGALTEVRDIFVTEKVTDGASVSRLAFGRDGCIYLVIGGPISNGHPEHPGYATPRDAKDPVSHFGKVLRLNDDGSAPADNPFAAKPGYKPEVYATGIRNAMSIVVHPVSGEVWVSEHGPQGGDEINVLKPGADYGWPTVSYGRSYTGELTGGTGPTSLMPVAPGVEMPWLVWSPSIGPSGMVFYTGDRFPDWKGSIFVGALVGAHLQRIVLNAQGLVLRQDALLSDLHQRIRDVRQGPDGFLYLITDEEAGALLRLEPVSVARR